MKQIKHGTSSSYNRHGCRCSLCKKAESLRCKEYRKRNPSIHKETNKRYHKKNPEYSLLSGYRYDDKKKGLSNDLTLEIVRNLIQKPCTACGSTKIKMGLDRKDNNLGHTINNVEPLCIRCNFLRKDMPYEAWIELFSGLREAEIKGAFKEWHPPMFSRIKTIWK